MNPTTSIYITAAVTTAFNLLLWGAKEAYDAYKSRNAKRESLSAAQIEATVAAQRVQIEASTARETVQTDAATAREKIQSDAATAKEQRVDDEAWKLLDRYGLQIKGLQEEITLLKAELRIEREERRMAEVTAAGAHVRADDLAAENLLIRAQMARLQADNQRLSDLSNDQQAQIATMEAEIVALQGDIATLSEAK